MAYKNVKLTIKFGFLVFRPHWPVFIIEFSLPPLSNPQTNNVISCKCFLTCIFSKSDMECKSVSLLFESIDYID
jgi:hypothetical protein